MIVFFLITLMVLYWMIILIEPMAFQLVLKHLMIIWAVVVENVNYVIGKIKKYFKK